MPRVTKQQLIDEITELKVELAKVKKDRDNQVMSASHNMKLADGLLQVLCNVTTHLKVDQKATIEQICGIDTVSYEERVVGRHTEVTATWII